MKDYRTYWYLILLSLILGEVAAQFDQVPQTRVVYLGQNAQFHCTVSSQFLVWRVDKIQAQLPEIQARNISHVFSGSLSQSSTLTILATKQNNNSEIVCIQQHLVSAQELARTSPVYLHIQGLLSAPSTISVETTQSTILLTWIPPFSLINISTYIVTITDQENADMTSQNTSVPYFWKVDHGYCRRLNLIFEIAAANPVGVGNRTAPINVSFHRPFVVVDPSNHTSIANCTIQCSNTELITWFVNGLPLPAFEAELHFRRYPKTPYCSQQHSMSSETHTLSILMLNRTLSAPLVVYCAVVTVCNKDASNCSEHTCFSDNAYLEPTADQISTSMSTIYLPMTSEDNHNSLTGPSLTDQEVGIIPGSHQFLLRTSLGLGATLSVLIVVILSLIVTVAIVGCCWHRRKHKRHAVESLYDLPMDPKRRPRASDVDSNAMQPCPAYERPERCMRMCGNSH